jgi:hypothetical protein
MVSILQVSKRNTAVTSMARRSECLLSATVRHADFRRNKKYDAFAVREAVLRLLLPTVRLLALEKH